MNDEKYSLLRLLRPQTLSRKKQERTFPPPPRRDPLQHGFGLRKGAERVSAHFEAAIKKFPQLATAVPYVKIQLSKGTFVSEAELQSVGLIPVYRREDSVLAAYSPERKLEKFVSRVDSYTQRKQKLAVLAKIEHIGPWSREDRSSARVQALSIEVGKSYTVDLLMLPIEGSPSNPQALSQIENFLGSQQGKILDRAIQPTFTALRVSVGGQALNSLLEYRDDIALVDLPPSAKVLVPEVLSLKLDALPEVTPPPATAAAICVVDSGILEGHPLLEPAVLAKYSRSFPPELGPPIPAQPVNDARHGTQVAGVALYGDVGARVMAKEFKPQLMLMNARLLDDNNELHPSRMPFIRDIVLHARNRCRVFNLSFGLEPSSSFLSVHAAELDALTREEKVLFVVSSGNKYPEVKSTANDSNKTYPDFLLEQSWSVLSPAEGLNVLTVGGVTPDIEPFPTEGECIAPKRAPSPFSRRGALKNVVKPELLELAGNLVLDKPLRRLIDNNPGLRVPTTSDRFSHGQLLGLSLGTSFAAPKVAHAAAHIFNRYPDASPNLPRALLVQSARHPEGVSGWNINLVLQTCGFGVPDLDRALYCRPQRATLYFDGEIEMDEVLLFEIPVPQELTKAKGKKRIIITLAYDPPISVMLRDRPAGVSLTWGVVRGEIAESDVQAEISEIADREVTEHPSATELLHPKKRNSIFMKGNLPKRPQQRGTIQKNVFEWQRGEYGETYRLAITAKATRSAHAAERQRFSIVVTLECEDNAVNVFQAVRARLAAGRVRARVQMQSE